MTFIVFIGLASQKEKRKPVEAQSEIGNLRRLQLKLQFVSDKGDEFGIGGFSLSIGNCVPKEPLQSIQIATIPGYLNCVSDCPLHSGRGSLECFRHLGVQYLGDGVDGVPDGPPEGFRKGPVWQAFCRELIAFFVPTNSPALLGGFTLKKAGVFDYDEFRF